MIKVVVNFVMLILLSTSLNAKEVAFSADAFTRMKQENQGKAWLMLLWSVDCPPCFKELAIIKKMRAEQSDLPIVVVNADDFSDVVEQRHEVIEQFGFNNTTTYYFPEGSASHSRYLIDPTWHGELPRSYFVDKKGQLRGRSGLVNEQHIRQWLAVE